MKLRSFKEDLLERLKDPEFARVYICEAIKEKDPDLLKTVIGDVVKAYGVSYISEQTGINRQTIYKMFAPNGNPTHKNLVAILDALGLELTVRTKKRAG